MFMSQRRNTGSVKLNEKGGGGGVKQRYMRGTKYSIVKTSGRIVGDRKPDREKLIIVGLYPHVCWNVCVHICSLKA